MEGTASEGLSKTHACKIKHQRAVRRMKLSIEAKVAAAVAIGFAALSIGAIAQEQSKRGTGEPNGDGLKNSPGLIHISARGSENSLSGHLSGWN
jgi:hypothetical protein